jgi:hypothetical protein
LDKARTDNERARYPVSRASHIKMGTPISISIKCNFILITPDLSILRASAPAAVQRSAESQHKYFYSGFTSYAPCQATASGIDGECYGPSFPDERSSRNYMQRNGEIQFRAC